VQLWSRLTRQAVGRQDNSSVLVAAGVHGAITIEGYYELME